MPNDPYETSRALRHLNPKLSDSGVLSFDCPVCATGHRIRVPTRDGERVWRIMGGEFPDTLSLTPSVDCTQLSTCGFHLTLTNGVWA